MSFNIVLQKSLSEKNRITKDLVNIGTYTGTLRADCSLIDPVITFEANITDLKTCNYMTISEFGRMYFVNKIRSLTNGMVEISTHVDVLSTYATSIKANKAIIAKSEKDWNLYLNDGSLKTYQNAEITTKIFPQGFTTQEFVLALAGS